MRQIYRGDKAVKSKHVIPAKAGIQNFVQTLWIPNQVENDNTTIMEEKGFIKYIVIVVVILAIVFLSQQAYLRGIGKNAFLKASGAVGGYAAKGASWVTGNLYPKISGEVQKRGDAIKDEVIQEKQKVSENILEKAKNYFSGIAESVLHPGENTGNQNCPPVQPTQSAQTKP